MNSGKLDEDLGKLVRRYGYERVSKRLMGLKQRPDRTEVVKNREECNKATQISASRTPKKSPPKKRPGAVAVVNRIEVTDSAKREVLIEMAEKFDRKEFLPHVSDVRFLLDSLGKKRDNIKSRTQVIARIFKTLAEEPVKNLREINNHQAFSGRPSSLQPIAEAIARAGRRDREQHLPEETRETR